MVRGGASLQPHLTDLVFCREAVRGRSASILKAGEVVHENDPMRDLIPDFKFIEPDQVCKSGIHTGGRETGDFPPPPPF